MNELELLRQHLRQPEYVHVLLNPLPVYGLAMGVLALAIGLAMRNTHARVAALILVVITCASAWLVQSYGEAGYDRVKAMSNADARQWLEVHEERGEKFVYAFYATAVLASLALAAQWKFAKASTPLAIVTLIAAVVAVGIGGWIGHAGGQVRHSEFRDGPPPLPRQPDDDD